MAAAVVALWLARRPLTDAVIARWFAVQRVPARYRIAAISPSAVSLADVSLGPSGQPDFTAEQIDARIGWSPLRPVLEAVTIVRPRLRATVRGGTVGLGSLERLISAPSLPAKPFPSIELRLIEGRVSVATAAGTIDGSFDGEGRLNDGFTTRGVIAPHRLRSEACGGSAGAATWHATSRRYATRFEARGKVSNTLCAGVSAAAIDWHITAALPPALDQYDVRVTAIAAKVRASGYAAASARLDADAVATSLSGPVAGRVNVLAGALRSPGAAARLASLKGRYRVVPGGDNASLDAGVGFSGASVTLPDVPPQPVAGTLAAPLLAHLAERAQAAAHRFDATARVRASQRGGRREANLDGLKARASTGAQLVQTGQLGWSQGALTLSGRLALDGGGLPATTLDGDGGWQNGAPSGRAALVAGPLTAPGASLEALRLDAEARGGVTTITGGVRVSGALGGGIVANSLGVPLTMRFGRGAAAIGTSCATVDWAGLTRDTARLDRGAARLCPSGGALVTIANRQIGGGILVSPLSLRGATGDAALKLVIPLLRLTPSGTTARPGMALAPARIEARYGARRIAATVGGSVDLAAFSGRGRIDAGLFDDPAAPVRIAEAGGDWQLGGGTLTLADAAAVVSDRAVPARFQPMRVTADATLAEGRVDARGSVGLAAIPARLLGFTATHALGPARGSATIDTGTLTFGPALQPYQITEALRGVVDNVRGPVHGSAHVEWTADSLTSRGTLAIDTVSLATAALGPVDGIAGSVAFDDLFAMTTPPGQVLRIARINPGVAVDDGVATFRLLGPDAAAIDGIRWPYTGGTLTLAPVVIRATDTRRDFVLTVDGLDAEQFLQKFEIKNINVTGRFDGRLPLVFADGKGRISSGHLVARSGGGLVQYAGDIGGENLGAGARLAFDALRRLRYRDLALDLDGDLDGELVTSLRFAGTNETQATLGGGPLPIRATGLPFKFNVTVRAPFRALLGTAASFSDVRPLIRPMPVQPQ